MSVAVSLAPVPKPVRSSRVVRPQCTILNLLDGFRLERNGAVLSPSANGRRLLAMLGLRGTMSRLTAAGMLWQEATERHALGSLRTTLWRLRGEGHHLIHAHHDQLTLAAEIQVDVSGFTAWALRMVGSGPAQDDDLDLAAVPTGKLLPGCCEDWVRVERERLRQLRLHALEALAGRLRQCGQFARAVEAALEAIRLEPLRESAHRALIAVYLQENNVVEAVRHYSAFKQFLHTELGIEPSPQLAALALGKALDASTMGQHDVPVSHYPAGADRGDLCAQFRLSRTQCSSSGSGPSPSIPQVFEPASSALISTTPHQPSQSRPRRTSSTPSGAGWKRF